MFLSYFFNDPFLNSLSGISNYYYFSQVLYKLDSHVYESSIETHKVVNSSANYC